MSTHDHLFEKTHRVAFQLSNRCNYACVHAQCPASQQTDVRILPAAVVYNVLDGLAAGGFDSKHRRLEWHIYNEPLHDPRLSEFICYAREKLPNTEILVWTNGWYLDLTLMDELTVLGVSRWHATAYSPSEEQRLTAMFAKGRRGARYEVIHGQLDRRTEEKAAIKPRACFAPLRALCIYPSGHFGLCCRDTKSAITFIDLNDQDFLTAFRESHAELSILYRKLRAGKRWMEPCLRCGRKS